ncbi:MAG: PH domain-containing protein [Verrucomicrobiales bacterium]|nr:PH domain-containing protein [Verrucomicrobiales bacterium]
MNDESVIWKSSPSQLLNLGTFTYALILIIGIGVGGAFFPPAFAAMIIPVVWAGWKWLVVKSRVYELTTQRLRLYEGVFNRKIDEIELYRVKDTNIEQPFFLRMFGLGILNLETSDRSHPSVAIEAISDVATVREHVRKHVEKLRDQKRVREVDFEGGGDSDFDSDFDLS